MKSMPKLPISVVIITKNEEENIADCLKSVSFAEEVIVIDSESTDNTVEIAKSLGAKVFIEKWKGYGRQKQSGVEKTKNKWILSIDADERIPPETVEVLFSLFNPYPEEGITAFSFCRKNILHGKWMKCCGWWPDRVVRLFDKTAGKFEGMVHEKWVISRGKVRHLDAVIMHYHSGYFEILQKMNNYSSISAKEMFKKGLKAPLWKPFFHGMWMFFRSYFLKKGFLYGFDGFIISFCNGLGRFFKYAKLRELWKEVKKKT